LTPPPTKAASSYIAVVDAHDLDDTGRTFAEYDSAHRALLAVTDTLTRLTREINQIAANVATELSRLESSLDQLPPRLRAAQEAMAEAVQPSSGPRTAGMRTEEVETDLTAVGASLEELTSAGLGGLGLAGAMRRAEEVRTKASKVAQEAADLAVAVQKTRNDLASVRTRVQMVAGRGDQVLHAMSELRRNYSANCWQDLQGRARRRSNPPWNEPVNASPRPTPRPRSSSGEPPPRPWPPPAPNSRTQNAAPRR
jgi:outer membrane murein-binding lipoprotein Lpp